MRLLQIEPTTLGFDLVWGAALRPVHLFRRQKTFYAEKPPEMAVFLRFLFYFCLLDDCGSAAISGTEKRREHERG